MSTERHDNAQLLNPYQRDCLSTTLSTLDEMLCEIEQSMTGNGHKRVLYEMQDDVPTPIKKEIVKRISLIMDRIEVMKEQFALKKSNHKASKNFLAKLAYGWEILEGAKARHLQKYGVVSQGLAEVLDPRINDIIILVDEIQDLVIGKKKEQQGDRRAGS